MGSPIDNFGGAKGRQFQKGVSPNPGGKPSFVRSCEAAGFDVKKLRAELVARLVKATRKLDPSTASWRFAMEQLLAYALGKPVHQLQLRPDVETSPEAPIDWSAVPLDQRKRLLDALDEIDALARLAGASAGGEH